MVAAKAIRRFPPISLWLRTSECNKAAAFSSTVWYGFSTYSRTACLATSCFERASRLAQPRRAVASDPVRGRSKDMPMISMVTPSMADHGELNTEHLLGLGNEGQHPLLPPTARAWAPVGHTRDSGHLRSRALPAWGWSLYGRQPILAALPLLWGRTDRRVLPPRGIIVQSCNARRAGMILGCGNEQLNPAGHPAVGLDNIIVIATLDGFHVLDVAHGSTPEIPSATVSSRDTYVSSPASASRRDGGWRDEPD